MSNPKSTSLNQSETTELLGSLTSVEEAAITGGAFLFVRESIGSVVPGASSSSRFQGSSSGSTIATSYSIGTSVRNGGVSAGKRSVFFGSLFDFF